MMNFVLQMMRFVFKMMKLMQTARQSDRDGCEASCGHRWSVIIEK